MFILAFNDLKRSTTEGNTMNANLIDQAYKDKILSPERHLRLIQNIDSYAATAGIPVAKVCQSAQGFLNSTDKEVALNLKSYIQKGLAGYVIKENGQKSIELRMQAMTGVFLRNFIDARLTVLSDVLANIEEAQEAKVLLIPNFLIAKLGGKMLPGWRVAELHGLLLQRHASGKFTIIYAKSIDKLHTEYGQSMREHVRDNYIGGK